MSQDDVSNVRGAWKERRKQQLREELLRSAIDLFEEKGIDATLVEDIAARTGVAKGTFYLYFKSKSDVVQAVLEMGIQELEAIVVSAVAESGDDPRRAIRRIVDAVVSYFECHRGLIALLLDGRILAGSCLPMEIREELRRRYRQVTMAVYERTFRKAMLQSLYREDLNPTIVTHAFNGMLVGLILEAANCGEPFSGIGELTVALFEKGIAKRP